MIVLAHCAGVFSSLAVIALTKRGDGVVMAALSDARALKHVFRAPLLASPLAS